VAKNEYHSKRKKVKKERLCKPDATENKGDRSDFAIKWREGPKDTKVHGVRGTRRKHEDGG